MKTQIKYIIIFIFLGFSTISQADVYFIFYATIDGKSGHAGIAVDNYQIIVKDDYNEHNERFTRYDTIKDGTLTYYDFWPEIDDFNAFNVNDDVPAKYYKLPRASWEADITINSLITKGIPHEEYYPVDGLLKLKSTAWEDRQLKYYIEKLISANQPFNVRTNNCSDFVKKAIEKYCHCSIDAKEQIVFKYSTTPNRLYQELSKFKDVIIIKDASEKAKGNFTMERLVKRETN